MKRLWTQIPPCLSDVLGFQAVVGHTKGLGVIDDPSGYKPLRHESGGGRWGGHGGDPRFGRGGDPRQGSLPYSGKEGGSQPPWGGRGGFHGGGRGRGGKGGRFLDTRIITSDIEEQDVITGTEPKLRTAMETGVTQLHPDFLLVTAAPCASMINTDLEEIAAWAADTYGIPAAPVFLDGQKDYLYGISATLEAMGKLLLTPLPTQPATVNVLGCNTVDWTADALTEAEAWLAASGFTVLSHWGMEETTQRLQSAAAASVNLVVNVAGLRLARYMEQEFGIPYVVGAPFGAEQCARLLAELGGTPSPSQPAAAAAEPEAVILGEQLTANSLRAALTQQGFTRVAVYSFYEMDKSQMLPGDKKLVSEDELRELLSAPTLRLGFGDGDAQLNQALCWVPLPNQANVAPSAPLAPFSMVGSALDSWLSQQLHAERNFE
jgi:hypothetical protein